MTSLLATFGLSFEQAKLAAIWDNVDVTSVCSLMPNLHIMKANVLAATMQHPLPPEVLDLLTRYAESSGRYFCRRCGTCDSATAERVPIFNVMECLMYARSYGARELAIKILSAFAPEVRRNLSEHDYSTAETRCPQGMPIARLMKEAQELFGN
ncbi:MAG: hypothetical protein QM784_04405 [Polyangiaceae bacterium]